MHCAFDNHSFVPFLWTLTSAILQFSVILKNWKRSISLKCKYTAIVSSLWRILRENFSLCIFPPCAARFFDFSAILKDISIPCISAYSVCQASYIETDSFVKILIKPDILTVLGSFGTTVGVSSEVSSCKYTYTYIINLRDSNTGVRL